MLACASSTSGCPLDRALDLFTERGFRAATMPDLATATGVQRGSLYHAYGGKAEIFLLAFGELTSRFLAGAEGALDGPTKRAAVLSFLEYCIRTFAKGLPSHGCLLPATASTTRLPSRIGYNTIALPITAGVFEPAFGLVLRPEIAALAMSGSSLIVALSPLALKAL